MKAYIVMVGFLAASLAIGCSKDKVPAPKDPDTAPDEPMLDSPPPPDKPLESGLIITASPNVEVKVDGKSFGKTPVTAEPLKPGSHDVTFMFKGDNKVTLSVDLSEGEYKKVNQSISPNASDAHMNE